MEVGATAGVYVDCASYDPEFDCHVSVWKDFCMLLGDIGPHVIHEWLETLGWLWLGDHAYCPVCRYQLHDTESEADND